MNTLLEERLMDSLDKNDLQFIGENIEKLNNIDPLVWFVIYSSITLYVIYRIVMAALKKD